MSQHKTNTIEQPPSGRENHVLRELVTVYRHLTGLALQNADIQTVAALLADRTASRVAVVSPTLDVLTAAAPGQRASRAIDDARERLAGRQLGRVLAAVAQTRRALRVPEAGDAPGMVVAPILVGDDIPAYLLTAEEADDELGEDVNLLVTEHAATICGVIMGRERVVAAAAGRVRDDLAMGLLLGHAADPEELGRWAQHLGYDTSQGHRVMSLVLEDADPGAVQSVGAAARRRRILDSLAHFVAVRAPDAIVAVRDLEMAIVVRDQELQPAQPRVLGPAQLAAGCLAHAGRLFPDAVITIGIGGVCRDATEVARAYAQSRRALGALRRLGRQGQAVAFEDLGVHRLLLQVPDLEELRAFADEVVGRLSSDSRRPDSGYMKTLSVYLRENGSLQRAARLLHVHPNTVTYRLNRIEEITGLDLGQYRDRLMAQVALEIVDVLGERR